MSVYSPKLKSHFALKIKLKSLHLSCDDFSNILRLKVIIFYDSEDEERVSNTPERIHIIEVLKNDYNFMFRASINKSFYLPIVCIRGECPQFINIICNIEKKKDVGLKLYLNQNYSFLKYYSSCKTYKLYECESKSVQGYLELALDIIKCKQPFSYFGNNGARMNQEDYYFLATEISLSKLKKEAVMYKADKDVDTHVESFILTRKSSVNGVNDLNEAASLNRNFLNLLYSSSKNAYDKAPIPLISTSDLMDFLHLELLPKYKKRAPSWLRVVNDAYDMYLCKHFQLYNMEKVNNMYEEIRACSMFFYLESTFVKIAANFAKSVIIQEYTKYTSPRYVDDLFSGKSEYKVLFNSTFKYEKIVGKSPLDIFKLFKNDEIYITNDTDIVKGGLMGILIFGDEKTGADGAYKKYNNELKAQQWINKGIAEIKLQNLKEMKKELMKKLSRNSDDRKISLSLLSFNLSTLVSYKGFKMYIIPYPTQPLNILTLDKTNGNLKHEMMLLERSIPTYKLFTQEKSKNVFLAKSYLEHNYVFYNINSMLTISSKDHSHFFDESKWVSDDEDMQKKRGSEHYSVKSFYSNYINVRNNINFYFEKDGNCQNDEEKELFKHLDIHLHTVVSDMEKISFMVPYDSVSLKMYLHSRGIKMKYLGRMLKFVTFRWLYNIIYSEILIRCIKNYTLYCIREICIFYKKRVNEGALNWGKKYGHSKNINVDDNGNSFNYMREEIRQNDEVLVNKSGKGVKWSEGVDQSYGVLENASTGFEDQSEELNSTLSCFTERTKYMNSSEKYASNSGYSNCSVEMEEGYMDKDSIVKDDVLNSKKSRKNTCSKKRALKCFINLLKIINKKLILANNLDSNNIPLLSELLTFNSFKKYSKAEMYSMKKIKSRKHDLHHSRVIKKIYKGNITIIDMFVVNMFNLILTHNYYKEYITSIVRKNCSKFSYSKNIDSIEEVHYIYTYKNIQKCLGIFFFPSLFEYNEKIKNIKTKKFDLYDLKLYALKIKRSLNISYMYIPTYKYVQDPGNIHLDISNENKLMLSNLIFFTIMYHHSLSTSNEIYAKHLTVNGGNIRRADWQGKYDKGKNKVVLYSSIRNVNNNRDATQDLNNKYAKVPLGVNENLEIKRNDINIGEYPFRNEMEKRGNTYTIKINSLLGSKDSITLYNNSDYFTLYALLNIVAVSVKLTLFEYALKTSTYIFSYISENSVISVHVRIMWLIMYMIRRYNFKKFVKSKLNKKCLNSAGGNSNCGEAHGWENYKSGSKKGSSQKKGVHKSKKLIFKDEMNLRSETYWSDSEGSWDEFSEELLEEMSTRQSEEQEDEENPNSHSSDFSYLSKFGNYRDYCMHPDHGKDFFFYYGNMDVYKKTYEVCSSILNNYFVFFHPIYLDFYLCLSWCNKMSKNYDQFLLLLRTALSLQMNMRLKNYSEQVMQNIKINNSFEDIIYCNVKKSDFHFNQKNDDYVLQDRVRNMSNYFVNDISYPHEDVLLCTNIKIINKCNSIYNIRLACTLHYFANSLFYYYNTNRIIKKYKNHNFVLNCSLYCIKILENVKKLFQSFRVQSCYTASVHLDISLMTLKTYFSESFRLNKRRMMHYALLNAKQSEEINQLILGKNHIDTLYSSYIVGLIYMYLENKKCIYLFEEICYYLLNYNYIYEDKNIVNSVFWYLPDHIGKIKCINGKGFLNISKIKSYLFYIWFNIFTPPRYMRKIMKILRLLNYVGHNSKRKNKERRETKEKKKRKKKKDKEIKEKRQNAFVKNSKYLNDENFYSSEQIIFYIKEYKHVLSKKDLFIQISNFNHLLKNNKYVMIKSALREKEFRENQFYEPNTMNIKVFYPNDCSYDGSSRTNRLVEYSIDNAVNCAVSDGIGGIVGRDGMFGSGSDDDMYSDSKSVTAYFLKKLIEVVESKVEMLYKEENYMSDSKLNYSRIEKKNHMYIAMMKLLRGKLYKTKYINGLVCKLHVGNSTIYESSGTSTDSVTASELKSDETGSTKFSVCFNNTMSNDTYKKSINKKEKYNKNANKHFIENNNKRVRDKHKFILNNNEIHIFMSLLYYFLNYKTFEAFYSEKKRQ
ncbi:conserved Plasmodium protein, unknown function [Plasmodium malariae]|uniref:Clu domain-containing protein n=1 Tax=Plasmodium malariae TaxID=5858 RepID=A0A1D3JM43_PLAMA|nr:conserved Plasmodium protein, unknown function [Plasmodium malariae]SBT87740.1 conserved Plasmodium protein, unknown function [Plasmodium malariae]